MADLPVYVSETQKIRNKALQYVVDIGISGDTLDIGCGGDIIHAGAFGIEARSFPHVNHQTNDLHTLPLQLPEKVGKCKAVFSSHALEHIPNAWTALRSWCSFIRVSGHLILYLPDVDHYTVHNPEHVQEYRYESFMKEFKHYFQDFRVVESGPDVGYDRYSFFLAAQRMY